MPQNGIMIQFRVPPTQVRRRSSTEEIANLLRVFSENESYGGELPCFNLDSGEEKRLGESEYNEYEENADESDNISVKTYTYVVRYGPE
ncbi:hypothetical protein TNCV_1021061 [Trichonephila clavipes]|uniref:Uncharacterized protein n=1 Tax=Trichonephila clavipes TaxID=2585209 RepID=A0A8X6SLG1_TRICX|nr:hypothetical protein TNCV_1021061 [Trichonephila clavipes]